MQWIMDNIWIAAIIFIALLVFAIYIYDVYIQKNKAILHNFPVLGHLRDLLMKVGPELRQYWVANDKEEQPFNRSERDWIYASATNGNNTFGFGTSEIIYSIGYPIIKNAGLPFPDEKAYIPKPDPTLLPCLKVMGEFHNRDRKYRPKSIVNISAMSFGSLSKNAIMSLNKGAFMANCYHNTGEGSVSDYHRMGADIMWQIGTGYFGCRSEDGSFDLEKVVKKVKDVPEIRCIEIKLSQGAKPGKGGILPGAKVTEEIARVRGIPKGVDCISPNSHSAFSNPAELVEFIEKIAVATGLPVGIKAAIGQLGFWQELADIMAKTGKGADFITIDGGEGGTGAAPLTFSDHVSLPFKLGFTRVYGIFQKAKLAKGIVWIGSAKLGFPDRTIVAMTMGCDLIHIAREAMLSIGCIQAQSCHRGDCPSGVATQNKRLAGGIHPEVKSVNFKNYIYHLRKELISISHAAGYEHPGQFTPDDVELSCGVNKFDTIGNILGYRKEENDFTGLEALFDNYTK